MNYNKGKTVGTLRPFTRKAWEGARRECLTVLTRTAKRRGQITYAQICQHITSIHFEPYEWDLGRLLGDLSDDSLEKHDFMISSLVVHKLGDQEPGQGFFKYAEQIGLDVSDRLKFWVEQMKKTHAHYST